MGDGATACPARAVETRRQRGGVLIEFSVSILALWLIVAATLDLGRAFAAAHVLQSAARSATRELALDVQAWNAPFEEALSAIYDPDFLVIDAACLERHAAELGQTPDERLSEELLSRGLTLNRLLRPLMIYEQVSVGGTERRLLRYPGALLATTASNPWECARTGLTVAIPEIDRANSRIRMHAVVEELEPGAYSLAPATGSTSPNVPRGTAAVQLRYPFQAVGLTEWRLVGGVNRAAAADEFDGFSVTLPPAPSTNESLSLLNELDARRADGELQAYALTDSGRTLPVYGGRLGLGFQNVLGQSVRPYRRVITAQAMAPREVIGPGS